MTPPTYAGKPDPTNNDFAAPASYAVSTGSRYAWAWSNTGVYGTPDGVLVNEVWTNAGGPLVPIGPVFAGTGTSGDGASQTFVVGEQDYALKDSSSPTRGPASSGAAAGSGATATRPRAPFSAYGPFNGHTYVPASGGPDYRERSGLASFRSQHPGGCELLYADGTVRFLKEGVARTVYRALATRAGGEALSADSY